MSLGRAVATVGGFTLLSRVVGFIRDIVLSAVLGSGAMADAFFVAFKLPNLFRRLFAEGAFAAAFVPLFSRELQGHGRDAALTFARQVHAAGADGAPGVRPPAGRDRWAPAQVLRLLAGPAELVRHGLWPLALVVAFTTAIAPFAKFASTLYVLVGLRRRRTPPNLRGVFLFARKMGIWAMLEVLLLGVFVAYTKLGDLVHIEIGPAVYALGLVTIVTVWADTVLDPDAL
jgi:Paraquat-inducible protein A/Lipid II flippase MurJ